MGNSGSTHNLNVERSHSELDSYLQTHSQQLRRPLLHRQNQLSSHDVGDAINPHRVYTAEWRRSYPTPMGRKNSTLELPDLNAQFRVLPTMDERLHLRATTNGAILNSGGTISGRKQTESHPSMPSHLKVPPMQRSRTFIFDSEVDHKTNTDRKKSGQTEFTRSQTLLHVKLKGDNQEINSNQNSSNLRQMQRHTYSEPDFITTLKNDSKSDRGNLLESLARPSRQNKYNKKRRAPDAPTEVTMKTGAVPIVKQDNTNATSSSQQPTGHMKQQLFAKNTDKVNKTLYAVKSNEKVLATTQGSSFERAKAERSSVSSNQVVSQLNEKTRLAYRREKSSDAIMLTSRKAPEPANRVFAKINRQNQRQTKAEQLPVTELENILNKPSVLQSSKIPQLKRTFYFGMDLPNTTSNNPQISDKLKLQPTNDDNQRKSVDASANVNVQNRFSVTAKEPENEASLLPGNTSSYKMVYDNSLGLEEKIDDNGLRVCIRPTLPRRQVDTPSFSPALAWRALSDDQERLQRTPIHIYRNVQQEIKGALKMNESPIQANRKPHIRQLPKSSHKTWTPEQDLVDENDERDENLAGEDDSSSDEYRSKCEGDGFLFYGSKAKKSSQDASSATSPVHVFSLSLPRDAHIQHEMDSLKPDNICIYKSLQKSKRGNCFNRYLNQTSTDRQSNKKISITQIDGSNNWLLHKNASNSALHPDGQETTDDRKPLPSIEPQSLKLLTGGKHVMYLPGNYAKPAISLKAVQTESQLEAQPKMGNNRHFKNRQRHMPESLQDKTPIFPVTSHDYTKSAKLDDDKPFYQRFSLQNPVRMFEKRLLTEKSVKCTETNAEHKIDLEALKRVEEDFQRKRAYEKENIRFQMRLHFGNDGEQHERYQSLPISPRLDSSGYLKLDLNDTNNNLFCRDDPEGCVASASCVSPEADISKLKYGATNILD